MVVNDAKTDRTKTLIIVTTKPYDLTLSADACCCCFCCVSLLLLLGTFFIIYLCTAHNLYENNTDKPIVHNTSHKLKNAMINVGGKPTHCPVTGGLNSPFQNIPIRT